LKKTLKSINAESSSTLLISSHDLGHITDVCERIVVLNKGEIIKDLKTSDETLKELEQFFAT